MNGLFFKRSWYMALIVLMLPFSNVSFAEEKKKTYDTQQLVRDAAILYRQHKLAEAAKQEKSVKLAKAKKRKALRLSKAKRLLKSKKKARLSKVAKTKRYNRGRFKRQMTVTATAYTSHVNQTDSTPNIAAWGDRLKPGMKVIAVSRDMLNVYGLKHRSKVKIKGLDGEYLVLDKMNKRWKKKIDIYMGKDLKKAFKWGRKKVELQWN
ncbi:MAG: 3D domain-containing protein [Leucothrix sp.]